MESTIDILNDPFQTELRSAAQQRRFVRLEYFTDLHEFIRTDALLKSIIDRDGTDYLELATGDEIAVKQVVSVNGVLSSAYPGYDNYSCSC